VQVWSQFDDVLSKKPGKTDVVTMDITLAEETGVISQMPYRLPDK